jgi:transcriptional regulator with XRE-family HTH domain
MSSRLSSDSVRSHFRNNPEAFITFLGYAVYKRRIEKMMTRHALADAAGLTSNYILKVERGTIRMSFDYMSRLCLALDYLPSQLIAKSERLAETFARPGKEIERKLLEIATERPKKGMGKLAEKTEEAADEFRLLEKRLGP